MKIRRLRSRLIISFLGVALLAMIPLVVVPYYLLYVAQTNERSHLIEQTEHQISQTIESLDNRIQNEILLPSVLYLRDYMSVNPDFVESLRGNNKTPEEIQAEITTQEQALFEHLLQAGKNLEHLEISILTQQEYLYRKSWLQRGLYFQDGNYIYVWSNKPIYYGNIKSEMEEVGSIFVKRPFILKPDSPNDRPQLQFDFGNIDPIVRIKVLSPNPIELEKYLPREALNKLFNFNNTGRYQEVSFNSLDMPTFDLELPVQVKLIPIIDQHNVSNAILSLFIPVTDLWEKFGFHTFVSFLVILAVIILAAVIMARSISKPIYELASASERMAHGDFDVRVPVSGSKEQRILSASFNDMAERIQNQIKQVQQKTQELEASNHELAQTHNFLQNIMSNISTGVMSIDRDYKINHVNRVGLDILRIPPCNGQVITDVIQSNPFLDLINRSRQHSSTIHQNEIAYELSSGDILPLQVSTVPLIESEKLIGWVITFHDLSDIRSLEEQIRRQERLAALGSMVAGVAHEIRNPLGIIRGSAQLLNKKFKNKPGEEGLCEFIIDEVNRLSRVVNDFLMFARPPVPTLEQTEVDDLIKQVLAYTQDQNILNNINYSTEIANHLPTINIDKDLCRQVFLNLFINAQDAMPEGGEITIKAFKRKNNEIAIEVIDSGSGIEPDQLKRIFDPFFTSKDSGTGLGLSLVHQIMSSHNGKIEVESVLGVGSTFRVIFPAMSRKKLQKPVALTEYS